MRRSPEIPRLPRAANPLPVITDPHWPSDYLNPGKTTCAFCTLRLRRTCSLEEISKSLDQTFWGRASQPLRYLASYVPLPSSSGMHIPAGPHHVEGIAKVAVFTRKQP